MAKRALISADGTPYSVWQRRTRFLCLLLLAWAIIETAIGAGFVVLKQFVVLDLDSLLEGVVFGGGTIAGGLFNVVVALLGLYGAKNPKRITLFFWVALINAVLAAWQFASLISLGQVDPSHIVSLIAVLALATCAWNVEDQTGYFDNHPKPEEDRSESL